MYIVDAIPGCVKGDSAVKSLFDSGRSRNGERLVKIPAKEGVSLAYGINDIKGFGLYRVARLVFVRCVCVIYVINDGLGYRSVNCVYGDVLCVKLKFFPLADVSKPFGNCGCGY